MRAVRIFTLWVCIVAGVAACGSLPDGPPAPAVNARAPADFRSGRADLVIERASPDTPREEIVAAVQAQLDRETMCFPMPALWLEGERSRFRFRVRYDLMTRDWGVAAGQESRARLEELVQMGFLTAGTDGQDGSVEYTLTPAGSTYLQGSIMGSQRGRFCAPSERRITELMDVEWGQFACGNLRAAFRHIGDDWPSWARTQSARDRVAAAWGAPGAESTGSVSMAREWSRALETADQAQANGELKSACYDAQSRRVSGDDLELDPPR